MLVGVAFDVLKHLCQSAVQHPGIFAQRWPNVLRLEQA
jgi:hypothetical protein